MPDHPLRRRYGLELGLGLALAGLAAWLVLGRGREPKATQPAPASPPEHARPTPAAELERATLPPQDELAPGPDPRDEPARHLVADEPSGPVFTVLVQGTDGRVRSDIGLELVMLYLEDEEVHGESLGQATSRADGRALFPLEPVPFRSSVVGHRLFCREAIVPEVVLEFGPRLPAEPVVLVLPLHGRLELRATRGGVPVAHEVLFELYPSGGSPSPESMPVRRGERGVVVLPAVSVGLRGFVVASCAESGETEPVPVLGPAREGELATVTIELGPLWPRVAVRMLDERGRPLAGQRFEGWVDYGASATPLTGAPESDERGRLEFFLPGPPAEGEGRALVLQPATSPRPGEPPVPRARLRIPDPLDPARTNELGDVVLPFAPGADSGEAPR